MAAPLVAPPALPVHKNRFAANKHSRTDADVIAVTAMSTKPPTIVENIAIEPLAAGNELGWRARVLFFAGMVILGGVRPHCSLTRTLLCRVDPDHGHTIASARDETLKPSSQPNIIKRDGLQV
jgi:hypothetical protein